MYQPAIRILTCCFILGYVTCHDSQGSSLIRERRVAAFPKWVVGLRKPVFLNSPTNDTVRKGGNARLICRVQETKRIKWFKNGTELDLSQSKNYVSTFDEGNLVQTHVLQLQDIELPDAGWYQCIASNENGKSKSDIAFITVHVAPFFKKTPGNVTITLDLKSKLSARLECQADGSPHPEISWSKDGGYDFPAAKERRMHVMEDGQSFYITEVKVEDQGVYSCRAKNDAGEMTVNATLTVLEVPSFVKPLMNKKTRSGETSVIECLGAGSPKPTVQWSRDGQPIHASDHRYFFTADNQLLIIVKSDVSDSGVFSCQLDNFLGTARQFMTLTVVESSSSTLFSSVDYFTGFSIFIIFISFTVLSLLVYVCALYCKPHQAQLKTARRRKPSSVSVMNLNSQYYPPEITIIPHLGTMSEDGMTKIQGDDDCSEECHSYYEDYQSQYSSS